MVLRLCSTCFPRINFSFLFLPPALRKTGGCVCLTWARARDMGRSASPDPRHAFVVLVSNISFNQKASTGLPWWYSGHKSICQCREHGFDPSSGEDPICFGVAKPVEKAMAPHSSTLSWKIPGMREPGRLQSMRSLRVGHD